MIPNSSTTVECDQTLKYMKYEEKNVERRHRKIIEKKGKKKKKEKEK